MIELWNNPCCSNLLTIDGKGAITITSGCDGSIVWQGNNLEQFVSYYSENDLSNACWDTDRCEMVTNPESAYLIAKEKSWLCGGNF